MSKFLLHVSYNCGINYVIAQEADSIDELYEKAQDFEEQGLRWVIEDEAGKPLVACGIHERILDFMEKINTPNENAKEEEVE